jgi:hypothetical protein
MDNTTEDNQTQNGTPEEGCCNTAAEQAPVTVEMIEEAFEHLKNMVNRCQTPVLAHILIDKGDRVRGKNATCAAVTEMLGAKGTEWLAAHCGHARNRRLRVQRMPRLIQLAGVGGHRSPARY